MDNNLPTMLAYASTSSVYDPSDLTTAIDKINRIKQEGNIMAAAITSRRVVQVFIADSNENIPLEDCLLYRGEEKVTDATDQELFFEIDIKSLLETHNAKRVKLVDKKVKDRTENLEPAKVRDLKMVVVTVATL
jgi:hypothetical protein